MQHYKNIYLHSAITEHRLGQRFEPVIFIKNKQYAACSPVIDIDDEQWI